MLRYFAALCACVTLAACNAPPADLDDPVVAMGQFKLGHAEVVAPNLEKLLVSQEASNEEWIAIVDAALEQRFRRFEGTQFYHIGVSLEAYSLPQPFVPGKSALAMRVTVWDDAAGKKLNEETELFHVIQILESRISMSKEEVMIRAAESGALLIEKWMREEHEANGWFDDRSAGKTTQ
ncbi:hypothetical protein [Pelagimonas varians]|uniref:DUF4136 domain-containing protein n=1 Tax=Pelagimonas varians TaxID=696760 RepID=A0A238KAR5_9RHOB|nr:hypothetical protein [Pelagimonas varians]PYG31244.1 hypothetical protein C8N36_105305 [Pelagimonas varians]SMX39943.1 hypothetical protein PEV8663_01945 [Pelagimonas varians]